MYILLSKSPIWLRINLFFAHTNFLPLSCSVVHGILFIFNKFLWKREISMVPRFTIVRKYIQLIKELVINNGGLQIQTSKLQEPKGIPVCLLCFVCGISEPNSKKQVDTQYVYGTPGRAW